ncbi:uncharacterized protein [Blastocystis hominis]|uniref:SAP domain-containing protein n=1 Tax=Blastocystis hominis TaxID=12968 RepID=D8M7Y4_BLAHO|nr:uncharacterized protein [Blastocystis hominis]CBK24173.2 unnamed protein product [Blastocystis hominis]|eukprot:XP_012898221.1 uncharacterized protein [Blastocystis hominis]
MSEVDFSSLPISKMRSTLKSLGLSGAGTKASLVERYQAYQNGEIVADQTEKEGEIEYADGDQEQSEIPQAEVDATMENQDDKIAGGSLSDENKVGELLLNEEVHPEDAVVDSVPQENDTTQTEVVDGLSSPVRSAAESGYNEMQSIENTEATCTSAVGGEGPEAIEGGKAPINGSEVSPDRAESLDIEAELDKREARSKKFGTSFDRESCRQQLLRVYSTAQVGSTHNSDNNDNNNNVGLLHKIDT